MALKAKIKPVLRSDAEVEALVTENMALVRFFANKFAFAFDYDECFSRGMDYMLRAAREHDGRIPFGTYDSMRIKWGLSKMQTERDRVKRGGGTAIHVHLDQEINIHCAGDSTTIANIIPDINAVMGDELADKTNSIKEMMAAFEELPERTKTILQLRLGLNDGDPMTLDEVGEVFGLTRERVRQIQSAAIIEIRKKLYHQAKKTEFEERIDVNMHTRMGGTK